MEVLTWRIQCINVNKVDIKVQKSSKIWSASHIPLCCGVPAIYISKQIIAKFWFVLHVNSILRILCWLNSFLDSWDENNLWVIALYIWCFDVKYSAIWKYYTKNFYKTFCVFILQATFYKTNKNYCRSTLMIFLWIFPYSYL